MTTPLEEFRNYTREEVELYLAHLQHDSTMAYIPTFVYMFLLILVGLFGNSLVIVVYTFKMTRTPLRIFIVTMAVFDLLTNAIIMPGKTYDLLHVWNFEMPNFCKVRMHLNASLVISSGLVLVAVATIRYMIVCHPFKKRVTLKQAKVVCVIIGIVSFFISIPYGLIHGTQTRKTPNPNITARYCQVDDSYVDSVWPRLNSAFFILVFTVCSSIVIYFYVCIGRATWTGRNSLADSERSSSEGRGSNSKYIEGRNLHTDLEEAELSEEDDSVRKSEHDPEHISNIHGAELQTQNGIGSHKIAHHDKCNVDRSFENRHQQETLKESEMVTRTEVFPNFPELSQSYKSVHINKDNNGDNLRNNHQNNHRDKGRGRTKLDISTLNSPENENDNNKDGIKHTSLDSTQRSINFLSSLRKNKTSDNQRRLFGRTSLMMLVITVVFFVGFVPFLGLNVFLALAPEKVAALEGASLAMYQLFLCSYLMNSAANSIVYSFFDRRFRKECLIFLKCSKKALS